MRFEPSRKFLGFPCSIVGTGTAYEYMTRQYFSLDEKVYPEGLNSSGYLSLRNEDKYIRRFLQVKKKVYFEKPDRITLKEFIRRNKEPAAICVVGHFIFAADGDYWSFFNNDEDRVVCVWFLE